MPAKSEPSPTNPLKQGALTENSAGIGTVTRAMVHARAIELAVINGRSAQEVSKTDWDEAKSELTGQPEMDLNTTLLESAPESERWDPIPGSVGGKIQATAGEDEDEEGRSDNQKLVEEGVAGAEHDQMIHARRNDLKK